MRTWLWLCLWSVQSCLPSFAQESFTSENLSFFKKQEKPMQDWFESVAFKIAAIDIRVAQDKQNKSFVLLHLLIASGGDWQKYKEGYEKANPYNDWELTVFNKFLFLCDIQPEQGILQVETANKNWLTVGLDEQTQAFTKEYRTTLNENLQPVKDKNQLFTKEIAKNVVYDTLVLSPVFKGSPEKNIAHYKNNIEACLRKHYKDIGLQICSGKAQFSANSFKTYKKSEGKYQIKVQVYNLSCEVFKDWSCPYEYISFVFNIHFQAKETVFAYEIDAKPASGAICYTPREDAYTPIKPYSSYQVYIEKYAEIMKALLSSCLEK